MTILCKPRTFQCKVVISFSILFDAVLWWEEQFRYLFSCCEYYCVCYPQEGRKFETNLHYYNRVWSFIFFSIDIAQATHIYASGEPILIHVCCAIHGHDGAHISEATGDATKDLVRTFYFLVFTRQCGMLTTIVGQGPLNVLAACQVWFLWHQWQRHITFHCHLSCLSKSTPDFTIPQILKSFNCLRQFSSECYQSICKAFLFVIMVSFRQADGRLGFHRRSWNYSCWPIGQ